MGDLWRILVETVHALPMYKYHKRYVKTVLLKEKPKVEPQDLAFLLDIPLGEAMVLLSEIRDESGIQGESVPSKDASKPQASLLGFQDNKT